MQEEEKKLVSLFPKTSERKKNGNEMYPASLQSE
jgi:hypothetical protein